MAAERYRSDRHALATHYHWTYAHIDDMDPMEFLDAWDALAAAAREQPYRGVRTWGGEWPGEPESANPYVVRITSEADLAEWKRARARWAAEGLIDGDGEASGSHHG
jgi:hypothetical protein